MPGGTTSRRRSGQGLQTWKGRPLDPEVTTSRPEGWAPNPGGHQTEAQNDRQLGPEVTRPTQGGVDLETPASRLRDIKGATARPTAPTAMP